MYPLYIIATPIGNINDITVRALKELFTSDFIACEDSRKTGILLKIYESKISNGEWKINDFKIVNEPRLISYYDEVEENKAEEIISLILEGKKISLVSDGGTPLISDPGFKLVLKCIKKGIKVVSIPGPAAAISALVSSGFPTNQFLFLGFLPEKTARRIAMLSNLKITFENSVIKPTFIVYESPHRIYKSLTDIKQIFGDIEVVIARELTKIHEEIERHKISNILTKKELLKGEITLLFNIPPK